MRFAWGQLTESDARTAPHPASYDWKNTRFIWQPAHIAGTRFAFDVERLDTPPPDLSLPCELPDFLRAWTRLEVLAKLTDEPVLALARREALTVPPCGEPYVCRDAAGETYRLRTGIWTERHLIFTCGYRVA